MIWLPPQFRRSLQVKSLAQTDGKPLRWPKDNTKQVLKIKTDEICVLHMASPTHYANLMIRYMVATKLATIVQNLCISSVELPYWNIRIPEVARSDSDRSCELGSEQHFFFEQMRYFFDAGVFTRFEWLGYGQRMENFPSLPVCRSLFQADDRIGRCTSDDCIVCPIRGAEILHAIHPGYTVVPVAFYEEMIEETRLTPIFMGQTGGDNAFIRRLRKSFPRAEFIPHVDPLEDFQTIRKATNIILPVSTFAWLAAWLSDAKTIVLPVFGIFNPKLFSLDLLPIGDRRYRFFQFPEEASVPLDQIEQTHAKISGQWYEVPGTSFAPTRLC